MTDDTNNTRAFVEILVIISITVALSQCYIYNTYYFNLIAQNTTTMTNILKNSTNININI